MKIGLEFGLLIAGGIFTTIIVGAGLWHSIFHEHLNDQKQFLQSEVNIPLLLSQISRDGREAYNNFCLKCHGSNAVGTKIGPSLIHYEEPHHGNQSFVRAIRSGVSAHHWNFGDMPAVSRITDTEIGAVIRYVRLLQKANHESSADE